MSMIPSRRAILYVIDPSTGRLYPVQAFITSDGKAVLYVVAASLKEPVTVFISNSLDQAVNVQVVACRDSACSDSVDVGSAITVPAGSKDARTLTPDTSGWLPFITVRVWCTTVPTSGSLDIWLVRSATDQVKIVDSLEIRDTDTHDTYTDPTRIFVVSW
jgi:hypothetical protein